MREMKFRAWDGKKYNYPELWDNTMPSNWKQYYALEQYTDFKDKNGLKIYEGDILKFYVGCRDLRKVIYQSASFGVVGVKDDREKTFTEFIPFAMMNQNLIEKNIYDEINSLIEVVGNIHENPELLK